MKKLVFMIALLICQAALGQPKVPVQVRPGSELLNVVQLLSGKTQTVRSTYQRDRLPYFKFHKSRCSDKIIVAKFTSNQLFLFA